MMNLASILTNTDLHRNVRIQVNEQDEIFEPPHISQLFPCPSRICGRIARLVAIPIFLGLTAEGAMSFWQNRIIENHIEDLSSSAHIWTPEIAPNTRLGLKINDECSPAFYR